MANLNVNGKLVLMVSTAETGALTTALIAAMPADATPPTVEIDDKSAPGGFMATATIVDAVSQDDLGVFVGNVMAAIKATGAVVVSYAFSGDAAS